MHLPSLWACWAWWVLAMAVAAVMALRGGAGGLVAAAFHLLIVGGRWLVWDTMELRLIQGAEIDRMPLLNKQFLLGVAVAAALVWFLRIVRRRLGSEADWAPRLAGAMLAVAVVLPVWGASFEVDRYTVGHGADFADWQLARQMGWSILWAVYAGGLIAGGFALRQVIVRYVAIGILALTIGKVLLVDMAGVGAVYRILSFLALGAVLVAASLIYQRHFGRRADASGTGDEPEAPGP